MGDGHPRSSGRPSGETSSGGGTWRQYVKSGLLLLVAGVSLYLLLPTLVSVFGSWRSLSHLEWGFAILVFVCEGASHVCLWQLDRIALGTRAWFPVATAQLSGNAVGRFVPGAPTPFTVEMLHKAGSTPAGNDGTDRDGDGRINPMSVTSPGTAKNCITVGACENDRPGFNNQTYGRWWPGDYPEAPFKTDAMANDPNQVVAFSSRGPTIDQRFKPDVVAPGTFVLSTRSVMIAMNNTAWAAYPPSRMYFHMGGTSMATPLTSGAVALLREYLRTRQRIRRPSAAMLKAALVAGAVRLPTGRDDGAVVDNDQGYGRVNLDAVVSPPPPAVARFLQVRPGLGTGRIRVIGLDVASSAVPLRIVLAYSDYPGSTLVNDLNLLVTAPDGQRYAGNQPVGGPAALDPRNNVEVIQVDQPASGTWQVQVVGSNVPFGPQEYALVAIGHLG
jgi:serine protease AprX